jgi:DNA-binding transcriptional ArsR family regulator
MSTNKKESSVARALKRVEDTLRHNFEIKDWRGVRIILGVAVAHYLPGEPLWLRIIGASRSGRTELLRAIVKDEDSVEMEALTPASIRGGLSSGERLLDRIDGMRVITKDLAPLITARKDARLEIFGLLRSVKDGSISADFNTKEGYVRQEVSFDWILAVTPAIEAIRQIESLLGERYVDLQWIPGDRKEMAFKAAENNPLMPAIRKQLSGNMQSLLSKAKKAAQKANVELSEQEKRTIAEYADVVALCRSPVQKDSRGNILAIPKPEIGTSLAQDVSRTASGLKLLGITEWLPYIQRLAWDCIPSLRRRILRALYAKPRSVNELYDRTKIPKSTIYLYLKDLQLLGVVRDEKPGESHGDDDYNLNLAPEDYAVRKKLIVVLPPLPKKIR